MMVTVRVIKLPPPLPASVASRGFLRRRRENFGILSHSKGNFNENLWNCKAPIKAAAAQPMHAIPQSTHSIPSPTLPHSISFPLRIAINPLTEKKSH